MWSVRVRVGLEGLREDIQHKPQWGARGREFKESTIRMCHKEQEIRSQCPNWSVKKGKISIGLRNMAANARKQLKLLKEGALGSESHKGQFRGLLFRYTSVSTNKPF